jgi:transposase InsO family protein
VYGVRKVWRQLKREGIVAPRHAIEPDERLGLAGAVRGGRRTRTTVPRRRRGSPAGPGAAHLHSDAANELWVGDFTCVASWRGFVYVAFVINVFSRFVVGWRVSTSLRSDLALDALEQAICERERAAFASTSCTSVVEVLPRPIESTQYLAIRYTERLAQDGIEPSVGSRGGSYDNALAETVIGLFKTEVIHRRGPWRGLEDVELATLEWVWWFNHHGLLEPLGYLPWAELEAQGRPRNFPRPPFSFLFSRSLRFQNRQDLDNTMSISYTPAKVRLRWIVVANGDNARDGQIAKLTDCAQPRIVEVHHETRLSGNEHILIILWDVVRSFGHVLHATIIEPISPQ